MRRAIALEGTDAVLELSRLTLVKIATKVIHLDQLDDGTWRLTYQHEVLPDAEKLIALVMKPGAVELQGLGTELKLAKAVPIPGKAPMMHFDETPNGTWRLIYSRDLIPDFAKLTALRVIRED